MKTTKFNEMVARVHVHTVIFSKGSDSALAVSMAMLGQSNRAIARRTGLSVGAAQYAVSKANRTFGKEVNLRKDFREGRGKWSRLFLKRNLAMAEIEVERDLAPKFVKLAER